jgi:hypothetical protein
VPTRDWWCRQRGRFTCPAIMADLYSGDSFYGFVVSVNNMARWGKQIDDE